MFEKNKPADDKPKFGANRPSTAKTTEQVNKFNKVAKEEVE